MLSANIFLCLSFLLLLFLIRLRLLTDDMRQIANCRLYVNQVQSPIRLNLSVDHHITGDLVSARIGGIAMNSQRKVCPMFIGHALG